MTFSVDLCKSNKNFSLEIAQIRERMKSRSAFSDAIAVKNRFDNEEKKKLIFQNHVCPCFPNHACFKRCKECQRSILIQHLINPAWEGIVLAEWKLYLIWEKALQLHCLSWSGVENRRISLVFDTSRLGGTFNYFSLLDAIFYSAAFANSSSTQSSHFCIPTFLISSIPMRIGIIRNYKIVFFFVLGLQILPALNNYFHVSLSFICLNTWFLFLTTSTNWLWSYGWTKAPLVPHCLSQSNMIIDKD